MKVLKDVLRSLLAEDDSVNQSYYFKIVLLPTSCLFDALLATIIKSDLSVELIYPECAHAFLTRKMRYKMMIQNSSEFFNWFKKQTTVELGALLN